MKKGMLLSVLGLVVFGYYLYLQLAKTQVTTPATPETTTTANNNSIPTDTPMPTEIPTTVPTTSSSAGQYKDGTYTGDSVNVFYGNVQVQVTISGGKLTDVQFLQYPNDRSTSIFINQQAMPLLKQEALQAQSASVQGVSGASATSQGFVQSLGSALAKA